MAKLWYDPLANKLKLSENGGAYSTVLGGVANAVTLQPASPGAADSGHVNISGHGIIQQGLEVSSPTAAAADILFGVSRSPVTANNEVLVFKEDGSVGIGTTNPVQKLHVEGQCVTGDTLILAPRAGGAAPAFEEVPIVELKTGDLVMSLNEAAGKIEPHRVKGLVDMDVKPVFRLRTASGRSIRTTGNHPYLTRSGWRKVVDIKAGEEIAAPRADG